MFFSTSRVNLSTEGGDNTTSPHSFRDVSADQNTDNFHKLFTLPGALLSSDTHKHKSKASKYKHNIIKSLFWFHSGTAIESPDWNFYINLQYN